MEHICMIVDLDGYRIRSGFIARELGVYSLKDGRLSWMFDNPLPFFYLDKKDQRTCHYVYRHVHGLPWQHMVKPIVDTLYRSCRTPERWLVAYRGGCLEGGLLGGLQIPCVNLGDFGCPGVEALVAVGLSPGFSCGRRARPRLHCPGRGACLFCQWMQSVSHRFSWGGGLCSVAGVCWDAGRAGE